MNFEPIILRYEGLDAEGQTIDLAELSHSLRGAAQLLGSAASIVATGEYAKRTTSMSVRVLGGVPRAGSWEIPAIIVSVMPDALQQTLFIELGKALATSATTKIVNYVVSKFKHTPSETVRVLETVDRALAEVGQTSRHAIDAVVRMSEQQRPAIRELVYPVGFSCQTMYVGSIANGAVPIDRRLRDAIDEPDAVVVHSAMNHEIMISEMDRVNRTCKFSFRSEEDEDRRVIGEITDPMMQMPSDPYSAAFSAQRWITVMGKLQTKAGEVDKLYISDIVTEDSSV